MRKELDDANKLINELFIPYINLLLNTNKKLEREIVLLKKYINNISTKKYMVTKL